MSSTNHTVSTYLGALPPERRATLEVLRELVRRVVPEAEEKIEYRMPAYFLAGEMICAFAAQKNYFSFYLCDSAVVEAHRAALGKLDCGKGCIRFRRLSDLPLATMEAILRSSIAARGK